MEEWAEVCQREGLSQQQQDILAKLGNKPDKSKDKPKDKLAGGVPGLPKPVPADKKKEAEKENNKDEDHGHPQIVEGPTGNEDEDNDVSIKRQEEYNEAEQTLGRVQFAIMQSLVQKMAENNQYDANNINELHRGSVVFREELTGIVNHRTTFQERVVSAAPRIARNQSTLDKETEKWANQAEYDDEVEPALSDHDNDKDSDLSFDGLEDRKKVVLSHSDVDKESPKAERASFKFGFKMKK